MKEIQERLYKESRLYRVCSAIRDMAFGAMIACLIQIGVSRAIISKTKTMLKNQLIYTSNKELIKDSRKHIKELGLENVIIDFKFKPKHRAPGQCIPKEDNGYEIIIDERYRGEGTLKHELYHVYRIENKKHTPFKMYEEWLATSHALKDN